MSVLPSFCPPSPRRCTIKARHELSIAVICLVAAAVLLLILLVGCARAMPIKQAPSITTPAEVHAGDFAEIRQRLETIQTSIQTITNNYALDGERANLRAKIQRGLERYQAAIILSLCGMLLLMFVSNNPVRNPAWRATIITIALAGIVGPWVFIVVGAFMQ